MPLLPSRKLMRVATLKKVAKSVAECYTQEIRKKEGSRYGDKDAIIASPRDDVYQRLVDAYEIEVDKFKGRHRFTSNSLINKAKIAGLFVRVCVRDGVQDLFVPTGSFRRAFIIDVAAQFVWQLICTFLYIDKENKDSAALQRIRHDFKVSVLRETSISAEVICFSMGVLWRGWGNGIDAPVDDEG